MKELFVQYITNLYQAIPEAVFEGLVLVFCLGTVLLPSFFGLKKGIRLLLLLLLVEYVFLLCSSMLIFRGYIESQGYNFNPFWSYADFFQGKSRMPAPDMVMNVVVFAPVGLLLGMAFRSMTWWKVLIFGGGLSVSIEALQFFFQRGFSEVDDVMHNTAGCVIGYGIYSLTKIGYEKLFKRPVEVL